MGRGKLYVIDPHTKTDWNDWYSVDSLDAFNRNIRKAGVTQYVELLRGTTAEIAPGWNREIDLLFIDGDHSYEGVRYDWETFYKYLTDFSVTIFHDTTYELRSDYDSETSRMGVARLVDEAAQRGLSGHDHQSRFWGEHLAGGQRRNPSGKDQWKCVPLDRALPRSVLAPIVENQPAVAASFPFRGWFICPCLSTSTPTVRA